jgi:hypothetical protein
MKKLLVLAAFAAFSFTNINAQTISATPPVSEEVSVMNVNAENANAANDGKDKEKKKSKKKAKACSDSKEKSCAAGEKKKGCCSHEAAPKKEGNQ